MFQYGVSPIDGIIVFFSILFLLLYIIFFMRFETNIEYERKDQKDCLTVRILVFRRCLYQKAFYDIQGDFLRRIKNRNVSPATSAAEDERKKGFKGWLRRSIKNRVKKPSPMQAASLFRMLIIRRFFVSVQVGAMDAALTGTICGFLHAFLGFLGYVVRQNQLLSNNPVISVEPNFSKEGLEIYFQCIISFTIGNLISMFRKFVVYTG